MTTAPHSVCALVLAGRRTSGAPDAVALAGGRPIKAFVEINGRMMLDRVISTLRTNPTVGEIHVSLPVDVDVSAGSASLAADFASGSLQRAAPADSPSASVLTFAAPRIEGQTVLVTTGDHPLLTPAMLEEFLSGFQASGAEAAVALTDADAIATRYPGSRRTRLVLAGRRFTGCNLFAFRGSGAIRVLEFWRRLDHHRKQPWRMARAIGLGTLGLYVVGRLSLDGALKRLSQRSGARLHAVLLQDPHAGIDVDTPGDLALVRSILEAREGGKGREGVRE